MHSIMVMRRQSMYILLLGMADHATIINAVVTTLCHTVFSPCAKCTQHGVGVLSGNCVCFHCFDKICGFILQLVHASVLRDRNIET